jgi:transcriptional regulator with XRE-family HTH domain
MDRRYCAAEAQEIYRLRTAKGWSQLDLAHKAEVDIGVVERAESGEEIQARNRVKLEKALGAEIGSLLKLPSNEAPVGSAGEYTWKEVIKGAKVVAKKAFNEWGADLVLSFAGPSCLFAGLVVTMLPLGDIVRTKMYTAIFIRGKVRKPPVGFRKTSAVGFTILVPEALLRDPSKKIVVIDDSITSGGTMEALRRFFKKNYDVQNVHFACCVCYDGLHVMPGVEIPEIVGIEPNAKHRGFNMPWEIKSFTFEQAIRTDPTLPQYSDQPESQDDI